jgi:hypothetical protein
MSSNPPFLAARRWRAAAALTGVGALATLAAVAPTDLATSPTAAPAGARPVLSQPMETPDTAPPSERFVVAQAQQAAQEAAELQAAEAAEAEPAPEPEPQRLVWDRLADCESGSWTGDGGFVEGSATWTATAGMFEGGLQFHPNTWDGYKDPGMPGAAYDASREQQIAVAERVLADQGWVAWPVCSRKLGLR